KTEGDFLDRRKDERGERDAIGTYRAVDQIAHMLVVADRKRQVERGGRPAADNLGTARRDGWLAGLGDWRGLGHVHGARSPARLGPLLCHRLLHASLRYSQARTKKNRALTGPVLVCRRGGR